MEKRMMMLCGKRQKGRAGLSGWELCIPDC